MADILIGWGYGRTRGSRSWLSDTSGSSYGSWSDPASTGMSLGTTTVSKMLVGGNNHSKTTTGGSTSYSKGYEYIYTNYPVFKFEIPTITSGRTISIKFTTSSEHTVSLRRITSQFNGNNGVPSNTTTHQVQKTIPSGSTNKIITFEVGTLLDDIKASGNNYGLVLVTSSPHASKGTYIPDVSTSSGSISFDSNWNSATIPTISPTSVTLGNAVSIGLVSQYSNVTHTLLWEFNGHSGTIVNKTSSSSYSWTPTVATFAPYMTGATSGSVKITCITYVNNVESGRVDSYITINLPSSVKPSSSSSVSDYSVVPNDSNNPKRSCYAFFGTYVYGKSQLRVTVTASGTLYGATIKTFYLTFNGKSYSYSNTGSATSHVFDVGVLPSNSSAGEIRYESYVTDSRGRSSSSTSGSISCIPYTHTPTLTMKASRVSGNESVVSASYTIDIIPMSVNGVNKNYKTIRIYYRRKDASGFVEHSSSPVTPGSYSGSGTISLSGFNVEYDYVVRLQAIDAFGSASADYAIPIASQKIIDISPNGNIAFNMTHPEDTKTHFAQDIVLHSLIDAGATSGSYPVVVNPLNGIISRSNTPMTSYVDISSSQSIAGTKTFTGPVVQGGSAIIKNSATQPAIYFRSSNNDANRGYAMCNIDDTNHTSNIRLTAYSMNSSGGSTGYTENYSLPSADVGLTASKWYNILTTKSAVTLAQGGTGATAAGAARTNLGFCKLLSSTAVAAGRTSGTIANLDDYKFYCITTSMSNSAGLIGYRYTNSTRFVNVLAANTTHAYLSTVNLTFNGNNTFTVNTMFVFDIVGNTATVSTGNVTAIYGIC